MNERQDVVMGFGVLFMSVALALVFMKNVPLGFSFNSWVSELILSFLGSLFIFPKKNMVDTIILSVVVAILMTILYLIA